MTEQCPTVGDVVYLYAEVAYANLSDGNGPYVKAQVRISPASWGVTTLSVSESELLTREDIEAPLRAEVERLTAQRDAVLALHEPSEILPDWCDHCGSVWPCPTARALGVSE